MDDDTDGEDSTNGGVAEENKVSRVVKRFKDDPYQRKFNPNLHWLSRSSYQKIPGERTNLSAGRTDVTVDNVGTMPPPPPPPRRGTSTDDSSVFSGISDEQMLQITSPPHTSRTHSTCDTANTLSSHGDHNRSLSSVGTTKSSNNETHVRDDGHSPVRTLFPDNKNKKNNVPKLSVASNVPMRQVQTATATSKQPPNSQSTPASAQASGASQPSQGRQLSQTTTTTPRQLRTMPRKK